MKDTTHHKGSIPSALAHRRRYCNRSNGLVVFDVLPRIHEGIVRRFRGQFITTIGNQQAILGRLHLDLKHIRSEPKHLRSWQGCGIGIQLVADWSHLRV